MGGCGEGKQLIYFQIKVMDCHVSLSILKQDGFLVPLPYDRIIFEVSPDIVKCRGCSHYHLVC